MNHTDETWMIWYDQIKKVYHIITDKPLEIEYICQDIYQLENAELIASAPRLKRENQELKKRIEELRSMLEAK